jgi:hypothetical protein
MMYYTVTDVDERYQKVTQVGRIQFPNGFEKTNEPFGMHNFHLWRWDKNITAWVEGTIYESGEWRPLENN